MRMGWIKDDGVGEGGVASGDQIGTALFSEILIMGSRGNDNNLKVLFIFPLIIVIA